MLKVGKILTVNDKKYAVASNVIKDDKEYIYLVDLSNPDKTIICNINADNLTIVNDLNLIEELELLFSETM